MTDGHIVWHFEGPVNLTATETATLTWESNTFNTATFGNFSCNVWLLRADSLTDVQVLEYDPVLLAGNQNVFNNSIQWTPAESDIDIDGPHAGTHQLAWDRTVDNPKFEVNLTTDFKGFSKGFNILPVNFSDTKTSSSSSSTSPPATTIISVTATAAPTQTSALASNSSSGVSQGTAIGLGVAFGCLLLLVISGGVWWYAARYRKRREAAASRREVRLPTPPPYKEELDGNAVKEWREPSSIPVEIDSGVEMPTQARNSDMI